MIFDSNKVMYVPKKYKKMLALSIIFATIDSHRADRIKRVAKARC